MDGHWVPLRSYLYHPEWCVSLDVAFLGWRLHVCTCLGSSAGEQSCPEFLSTHSNHPEWPPQTRGLRVGELCVLTQQMVRAQAVVLRATVECMRAWAMAADRLASPPPLPSLWTSQWHTVPAKQFPLCGPEYELASSRSPGTGPHPETGLGWGDLEWVSGTPNCSKTKTQSSKSNYILDCFQNHNRLVSKCSALNSLAYFE